jgi:hypothetical protein
MSISSAAAFDDVYQLAELAHANKSDPVKLAKSADALEESIPRLDPVRFRGELEHVLKAPDLPVLQKAKEMATAALEGRLEIDPDRAGAARPAPAAGGIMGRFARLLRGR